MMCGRF